MSASYKFVEIGANLTDPCFRGVVRGKKKHDDDFDAMLERAREVGVEKLMVTAGKLSEARAAIELCLQHADAGIFTTVGVHPTRCLEFEKGGGEAYFEQLAQLLAEDRSRAGGPRVVAIGECGLDYDRLNFCPKEPQLKWFERQFALAECTGLPMFLHSRAAGEDFRRLVSQHRGSFRGGVVHSFTGSAAELDDLLALGLDIGLNGCSLKTAENLEVAKRVPIERLHLETDAPWCGIKNTHAGVAHVRTRWESKKADRWEAGKMVKDRNEPCTIVQVLEVLAAVRGEEPAELAARCYRNSMAMFFPNEKLEGAEQ